MNIIWICPCGCKQRIYRDEEQEIWIDSELIEPAEQVTHIDEQGFVNGKYSVMPDGLLLVQQELEFPQIPGTNWKV